MAYLKPLHLACDQGGCPRGATVALINRFNADCGHFCKRHGKQRLGKQRLESLAREERIESAPVVGAVAFRGDM